MSRLPFELFLALRYLRPKRTFVSIITLISILGVALGVGVLIIVISVMSGFDHDLRGKILGFSPHVIIKRDGELLQDSAQLMRVIAQYPGVKSVSPFVVGPVLVETQSDREHKSLQDAPVLSGVDPQTELQSGELPRSIRSGEFDLSGRGLVVGVDFASNLHLRVGDHLSIYSAREIEKIKAARARKEEVAFVPDDYEVRGIFDVGYYENDARYVITSLENAQDLYGLNESVHGLFVKLKDPYQAYVVKNELMKRLGTNFVVSTWMDENASILTALVVEKNVMFYLLFFIVLVAALCILSAQITFVIQKTREIGMLKALGASKLQISGIFLVQSAIIGVIGVASGFALGMLAVHYRKEFLHGMRSRTGWELFPASVYGFGELPALLTTSDVVIICVSSFVICILGGLLPAVRAGNLKPVEALRYE